MLHRKLLKETSDTCAHPFLRFVGILALGLGSATAQEAPRFADAARLGPKGVNLQLVAPSGTFVRVEGSSDLTTWTPLQTLRSRGTNQVVDTSVPTFAARYYRALQPVEAALLTGDHLATDAGEVVIHPINHASFVFGWQGRMFYNDPVGGAALYSSLPRADLILVSHQHGDHFDAATLAAARGPEGIIIAPAAVYSSLSTALRARTTTLANGQSTNLLGLTIEAIPAYNSNHPKGTGNGYVLTLGGRRIYISGDTGAIPETRALTNIDVAFLCMNVPFTMSVAEAVGVTRDFRPRVLYPYHYRNQNGSFADLNALQRDVGTEAGVEIRTRAWY